MKKYQKIKLVIFIILFLFVFNFYFIALADNGDDDGDLGFTIGERLKNVATGETGAGFQEATNQTLTETIGNIIKIVLTFLGVVFLILVIYGGYIWMTAHGNEEKVNKAKDLITEATIGLVIILGAYLITYFVVNALITQTGYQE